MIGEVWVFTELDGDKIAEPSLAVLGEGRRLAIRLGVGVVALLVGTELAAFVSELARWGVEQICLVQDKQLADYVPSSYTGAVTTALRQGDPIFCLAAATPTGNDVAPRVAVRLGATCATDAFRLDLDTDGTLLVERQGYNGRANAQIRCSGRPVVVTLQPGSFRSTPAPRSSEPQVVHLPLANPRDELLVEMICHVPGHPRTVELDQAEIIVVGGGGVGSAQGFEMLWELAELLGGTVGGTRIAIDRGWLPPERQIGQTGVTVSPKLMISCGVSGAMQHVMGLRDTDFLVAINTDRRAPIFQLTDFGVIGDLHQVVPAFIEGLRQMRN